MAGQRKAIVADGTVRLARDKWVRLVARFMAENTHLTRQDQADAMGVQIPTRNKWLASARAMGIEVPDPVTRGTAPRQAGCAYYEAALRELMQLLVDGVGAVEHVRCSDRNEGTCEWRAEWRPIGSSR